jgi:hypothetical protein
MMSESQELLRRARSAGRTPNWEKERLVMEMKELAHTSSRLQLQQDELRTNLQAVLEMRKETESFIQEFESHVASTALGHEKNYNALTIKLKAKLLALSKQCHSLEEEIQACKRRRRVKYGELKAFISECTDIERQAGLVRDHSKEAHDLAALYLEHCQFSERLEALKTERD